MKIYVEKSKEVVCRRCGSCFILYVYIFSFLGNSIFQYKNGNFFHPNDTPKMKKESERPQEFVKLKKDAN